MDVSEIGEIKSLLSEKKEIVIIPHKNPDGDAIGASTGLKNYLDNYNHNFEKSVMVDELNARTTNRCKQQGTSSLSFRFFYPSSVSPTSHFPTPHKQ